MNGPKKGKTIFAQASILKRAAAFAIDLLIINLMILFPFDSVFQKIAPSDSFSEAFEFLSSNADSASIKVIIMSASIVTLLYFVVFEKKLKQTPGKMLFRLYVEAQGKDLKYSKRTKFPNDYAFAISGVDKQIKHDYLLTPSYWQLFVRSMFLMPWFPFTLLWLIDPIVMLFTKENQRLSEILSRTKVVEEYKV